MRFLSRPSVLAGVTGVAALAGAAVLAAAALFTGTATAADAPGGQPSTVENHEYPNADRIFAERGIKLIKGDGHILFVDCSVGGDILRVESHNWAGDRGYFCFKIRGASGYLTLELPSVYLIKGDSHTTAAKVTQDEVVKTVTVPENQWVPVGVEPDDDRGATLLELRVKP